MIKTVSGRKEPYKLPPFFSNREIKYIEKESDVLSYFDMTSIQ